MGRVDAYLTIALLHYRFFINAQIHDMLADIFQINPQKSSRPPGQNILRQIDMAFTRGLLQRIEQAAPDPVI